MENTEGLIKVFVNGKLPKDKYPSANELLKDIADVLAIDQAKLVVELINLPDIKGDKGDKGDRGSVGPQGEPGGIGATGPAGPAGTGLRYLGDWDVGAISYSSSDVVLYGGVYYVCKDPHVSGAITEPGVGANWTDVWDVLDPTFVGQDGISFIWQSQWVVATTYNANDVVFNNGNSYICILGHLSDALDEPGVGVNTATYWDLMTGIPSAIVATSITLSGGTPLDTYVEGTWVPVVTASAGTAPDFTTADGNYTRIGRRVFCTIDLSNSVGGTPGSGGGQLSVSLPFSKSASQLNVTLPLGRGLNNATDIAIYGEKVPSTNTVLLYKTNITGSNIDLVPLTGADLNHANIRELHLELSFIA